MNDNDMKNHDMETNKTKDNDVNNKDDNNFNSNSTEEDNEDKIDDYVRISPMIKKIIEETNMEELPQKHIKIS